MNKKPAEVIRAEAKTPAAPLSIRLALSQRQKDQTPPGLEVPWYVIEEWQEEPLPAPDDEEAKG